MAKKYFVLMKGKVDTERVFTGSQPRRAALKAATRGVANIRLRERGTKKVHMFKGSRKRVEAPMGAPSWLPAIVWKPIVRKLGIEHMGPKRAAPIIKRAKRKAVKKKARARPKRKVARKAKGRKKAARRKRR